MAEEAGQDFEPKGEPSPPAHGQWTNYAEDFGWTSPEDVVREKIERYRRFPDRIGTLAGMDIPEDHEPGQPLPIGTELRVLFSSGIVGKDPDSIVTVDEFLAVAPDVYGLDPDQLADVRDNMIPEVEAWDAQMQAQDLERRMQQIEEANRFILQTWTQERFNVLLQQVIPQSHVAGMEEVVDRFTREHGNDLVRAFDGAEEAVGIENVTQRQERIQHSVDTILELASQITRIHPTELTKIAEQERYSGYLFLDSIGEQLEVLDHTYPEYAEQQKALKEVGHHVSDEGEALHEREEAIGRLRFGAQDAHSVQDVESFLRGEGAQPLNNPGQTVEENPPSEDEN